MINDTGPAYTAAMASSCPVCGSKPGVECQNIIRPGEPLPGRLTHIARTESR